MGTRIDAPKLSLLALLAAQTAFASAEATNQISTPSGTTGYGLNSGQVRTALEFENKYRSLDINAPFLTLQYGLSDHLALGVTTLTGPTPGLGRYTHMPQIRWNLENSSEGAVSLSVSHGGNIGRSNIDQSLTTLELGVTRNTQTRGTWHFGVTTAMTDEQKSQTGDDGTRSWDTNEYLLRAPVTYQWKMNSRHSVSLNGAPFVQSKDQLTELRLSYNETDNTNRLETGVKIGLGYEYANGPVRFQIGAETGTSFDKSQSNNVINGVAGSSSGRWDATALTEPVLGGSLEFSL